MVTAFHDRSDPDGPFGAISSDTDAASRNVLVFELTERARVILRPSGTEPKNKAYVEYRGQEGVDLSAEVARVEAEASRLAIAFVDEMLSRAGISLPAWAHSISGLVPVEGKVAFVDLFLRVVADLSAGQPVDEALLRADLASYGDDSIALFSAAVEQYLADEGVDDDVALWLRALFNLT